LSYYRFTQISEVEDNLINQELKEEFLGLLFKMVDEGVTPLSCRRALAVALRDSLFAVHGSDKLLKNPVLPKIIRDIGKVIFKYQEKETPYYLISGALEFALTEILGWSSKPQKNVPDSQKVSEVS